MPDRGYDAGAIFHIHRGIDTGADYAHADDRRQACADQPFEPSADSGIPGFWKKDGGAGAAGTLQIDLRQGPFSKRDKGALFIAARVAAASFRQNI